MLTETAKNDLAALRQQGFKPTDEEIVELNDLAVRIERGKDTTPANMPRVGFAGNAVLHEPTVGALEWWNDYGQDADMIPDARMMTYFFMLAHARSLDYLATLQTPKDIRNAVKKWKKHIAATDKELWRAMMWVKYGANEVKAEYDARVKSTIDSEEAMDALWYTIIAAAGALGVSPDDLKTCTHSELVATLVEANLYARNPMKMSIAKDYIAYRQLMKKIEERGKDNG